MQYYILAFMFLLGLAFFYKVTRIRVEPDFKLKCAVNSDKLAFMISSLASNSKKFTLGGSGLSVALIKKYIVKAYKIIAQKDKMGQEILPFENWIYDNFYLLNREVAYLKNNRAVVYKLPCSQSVPRLYELISLVIKSNEGFIDSSLLEYACSVFNSQAPLNFSEVCAVKYIVKYCLMEYIAIFCAKATVINSVISSAKADAAEGKINFNNIKFSSYEYGYSSQSNGEVLAKFKQTCADNDSEFSEQINNFFMKVSKYNGMLSSAVKSLISIDAWCNDAFIISLSPISEFILADNIADFKLLNNATKFMYCYYIAKMARKKKSSETGILRELLFKAKSNNLEFASLILPPPKSKKIMALCVAVYMLVAASLAIILSVIIKKYLWLYIPIFMPISIALSVIIVNGILKSVATSRRMPAYDMKHIDDIKCHTLITVPMLVASSAEATNSVRHLQTIMSANQHSIFGYCLLLDFPKSASENGEDYDEAYKKILTDSYNNLLQKERVCIIVRNRKKIDVQDKFQGWEKKRGALIELNKYILGGANDFMLTLGSVKKACKYVVTIDSDTLINSCSSLVEIMEHPYNKDKTIVSISASSSPKSANKTYFSKLFCGGKGLNNYSEALHNLDYNIFSCGNYTGKGIYRVKEFDLSLSGAFPENRILSHDFLEGAWANCGESNVQALDSFPKNYSEFLTRELRWLRGDWQLMPYLMPTVKNAQGEKIKNKLSLIAKWHIFCNMLFSLLPIASLALLLTSFWAANPLVIILIACSLQIFRAAISIRHLLFNPKETLCEVLRQFFAVAVTPSLAVCNLYAIAVTLNRLINKRNLLDWRVFAHSDAKVSFIPNAVLAIIVVATTLVFNLGWGYYVLGVIFLSGILLNYIIALPVARKQVKSEPLDAILIETAKRTFEYFNICATEEFNFLPCDNFQEYQELGFVTRTSPTNIGMYLMACISAYELKIIDGEALQEKLEKTIGTVEKLKKWKGNLYNWIDVKTLETLSPKYVSTVDSGNFLACLMAASVYAEGKLKSRINAIIDNTDIGALLDTKRGLFYIGYNCDTGSSDGNHYDLLGSECALTYLVAVALGKAPKQAWNNLSRETVKYKGSALYSWTGGMFEYLMTRLFFKFTRGTLMYVSSKSVVKSQIHYAKKQNLSCFGISECQNGLTDDNGYYQYKAYGVPQLAHSNIDDCSIIAPYASFLSVSYDPLSVLENTRVMENLGVFGKYGFYESFDANTLSVQKTYMTHHQGMLLTAITNYITKDIIVKKLQSLPTFRAASLLLAEVNCTKSKRKVMVGKPLKSEYSAPIKCGNSTVIPYVNLLSNGNYKLVTTSKGDGYSYFDNKTITSFDYDGAGSGIFATISGEKFKLNCGEFIAESGLTVYNKSAKLYSAKCETRVLAFIDGHVSHISFTYLGDTAASIAFSSFAPISLDTINGYMSHPLYSKMFVETGLDDSKKFMWAKRSEDGGFFAAHFVIPKLGDQKGTTVLYEGNRTNLFARIANKQISFGRVLEPVFYASFECTLPPNGHIEFYAVNLVSASYEKLKSMVSLCGSGGFFERQIGGGEALCHILNIGTNTKLIASALLYGSGGSIKSSIDGFNMRRPIIALKISGVNQIDALKIKLSQLKKLYEFGIAFNLVVLYKEKHNYYLHLTDLIHTCVNESGIATALNVESIFKIINFERNENLAKQILDSAISIDDLTVENLPPPQNAQNLTPRENATIDFYTIEKPMGIGGYTPSGDYCMDLTAIDTPAPWSNIIAESDFGTLITESGGGYTFGANAREYKLTKWSNDPLEDFASESIILSEQNLMWSITKNPIKTDSNYFCLHALGYSEFKNNYNGIASALKEYIALGQDSKIYEIDIVNNCDEQRQINIRLALNLVLGDFKLNTIASSSIQKISDYCFKAQNCISGVNAYINCDHRIAQDSFNGVFAANSTIILQPYKSEKIIFSLGTEQSIDLSKADEYFSCCVNYFNSISKVEICGDNEFKYLLRWLPYQVLCSRFNGRTGFYQSSGAFGFRDQLQDCMTLLYINPALVRAHILECAMHQFAKGDVQHWWHAPSIGVRTKICDDKLFLPYLVAEYIDFTHDYEIVAERVPFLQDVTIGNNDASVYSSPTVTATRASLLEHCIRAIDCSIDFGADGLMLMRGGDWNDAMDKVGEKGVGTSVWCSMFLYFVIDKFLPLVNDKDVRSRFSTAQDVLIKSVDNAWEGDRYARAYTDDGRVLGAERSEECKIDLLCQAWATLSRCTSEDKRKIALSTAADLLVDKENKLIKLLSPPFKNMKNIGYISAYPQGVRENGGQYTHAAVWFIMSCFASGKTNEAYELLTMISPNEHTKDLDGVNKYFVEPYVVAADVYSGDFAGRGGWSWYTGSASWLYKCLVENLLGIKFSGNTLKISPKLPSCISQLPIKINTKYGTLEITIDNTGTKGDWRLKVGQVTYNTNSITLSAAIVGKKITLAKQHAQF